jgi:hypothetical protein
MTHGDAQESSKNLFGSREASRNSDNTVADAQLDAQVARHDPWRKDAKIRWPRSW